ncbi:MAG: hypothetical protein HY817_04885 [Candidatus Abawacabacteria bacterium]|nr:hypothetical protein [Candidatus Abawacabacteria bacterium]
MVKNCLHCQKDFEITAVDRAFLQQIAPTIAGKLYPIPDPNLCPPCRERRRFSFRNDRVLYLRKSSLSGKVMLSIYSPDKVYQVYDHDEWWGNGWDALQFGKEFDFTRPFFEQFAELQKAVPRMNLYVDSSCENCNYSNQLVSSKNCYLIFSGASDEDCYYGYRLMKSKNCVDCFMTVNSELCYQCVDATDCYNCAFSQNIVHCRDSRFLFDCQNCDNCLFSVNLRNKSYCIFNKQYSKEDFAQEKAKWQFGSYAALQKMQADFASVVRGAPHLFAHLKQVENVTGDNVHNAKDCTSVFNGSNLDHVSYTRFVQDAQNCMDVNFGCDQTILNYEVCTTGVNAYNILFCLDTWPNVSNLLYCDSCANGTKDCFGCIGLKGKQYCILNKQYTKEQYELLVAKIIEHMIKEGEWGEFFPPKFAPVGYNESLAADYYPLTEAEAKKVDFVWSHYQAPEAAATKEISAQELPDEITAVDDTILQTAIRCESSGQLFRITKQELAFYRQNNFPLPRKHPTVRHLARLDLRGEKHLLTRECAQCGQVVKTVYTDNQALQVYCENCYLAQVY